MGRVWHQYGIYLGKTMEGRENDGSVWAQRLGSISRLDSDLADMYEVEVAQLKRQMRRNNKANTRLLHSPRRA